MTSNDVRMYASVYLLLSRRVNFILCIFANVLWSFVLLSIIIEFFLPTFVQLLHCQWLLPSNFKLRF